MLKRLINKIKVYVVFEILILDTMISLLSTVRNRNKKITNEEIMEEIIKLNEAIAKLQSTADAVVTKLNTPHPTASQVLAAADAVNAQAERLLVALGETPPVTPEQ